MTTVRSGPGSDGRALAARLGRLVSRFPRVRVAVVGDLIADEFIYGRIERVSREAPVLILGYDSTEIVPPCWLTVLCTLTSPSPVPREPFVVKNGRNS